MRKICGYMLAVFACFTVVQHVTAQNEKSFKESFADFKKAFHPDKAFILPFNDTTNEDLQAFLFAVQSEKGVKAADVKIKNGKAVITVDTKSSMVTIWDNLDKEYKNRYTVTDRTSDGFILADSYQTNSASNQANTPSTIPSQPKKGASQPTTSNQKQHYNSTKPKNH